LPPIPSTWTAHAPADDATARRQRRVTIADLRACAIALVAVAAAVIVTRATWPLLERTPLLLLFGATFVTARWGSESAALLAIVVAALAAGFVFPPGADASFGETSIVSLVTVSLVVNRIIVGRNRAESALRASEGQFRAAWDNSAFGAALLNERGMVTRINPAMERTLGYPGAAWAGVSFGYFGDPDVAAEQRQRFLTFIGGSDAWYEEEQRYRRADGTSIWCRVTMSAVHDGPEGRRTGALMVLEDVTRRRRAEDDLHAWEERYRKLFDEVPVGLFQSGADGRLFAVNQWLAATLGAPSVEALRGAPIADYIGDRTARSTVQDALASGRSVRGLEIALQRQGSRRLTVVLDMRPVRGTDGVVQYFDGTIREA
jgi:PAS domain S-box-containing protein